MPVTEQRRAAYLELVAAGIMAPDGEEFRFTDDGWARRDQVLDVEQDRIERERYAPPQGQLSRKANRLLRECVERGIPIGDRWNRPAFRELVKARVMVPCGSFTLGDECVFRWTYWGHRMRFSWRRSLTQKMPRDSVLADCGLLARRVAGLFELSFVHKSSAIYLFHPDRIAAHSSLALADQHSDFRPALVPRRGSPRGDVLRTHAR